MLKNLKPGDTFPDFELPDENGVMHRLSDLQGNNPMVRLAGVRPGGRLLVLQPNIRFVGGAYWDFIDHHLPLTDRTLVEACESLDLEVLEVIPRFLPYTTRSALPQRPFLVRLYLAIRPAWFFFGQQTWFVARKPHR